MTYAVAELHRRLEPNYRIERLIGAGGMAQVFLGTDLRHDRQVAIKVLQPEIAQALGPARFLREIAIISKLAHPNIVPLYDSGGSGEFLYYVMPFVGESLRELLAREGRLGLEDAVRLTLDVAAALGYAHAAGIVHRDIKPENILVGESQAVVTDFGIAKAILAAGGERLTSGRLVVGTPAYMSPEQAGGDTALDGRSDLYSLALVLYEMLAGDLPYRAPTPQGLLGRKLEAQYPRLQIIRSAIPPALDEVLARGLAADPADRYKSVADFAAALRAAHEAGPGLAKRRRARLALILAAAALFLAVAVKLLKPPPTPPAAAPAKRLLVAPLENRSGVDSLEQVGLMVADWVTEGLQQTGVVEVVPTATAIEAFRFAARDSTPGEARDPVRTLANETGAGLVVVGSYYRQRDQLLFRVQIADVAGSRVVEALEDISAPLENPLAGIEEVRTRLMGWLSLHYDERLQAYVTTGDRPPTYRAYLAFSEALTYYTQVQNARALPLFLRAAELDSAFVPALLYASLSLTNLGRYPAADSMLHLVDRRRAALSPYHRAWLDYRLAFLAGDHQGAFAAIRDAARMAPQSKATYNFSAAALQGGHPREADSALRTLPVERGSMRGFLPYWILRAAIDHVFRRYDREYDAGLTAQRLYPGRLAAFIPSVRARAAQGRVTDLTAQLRAAELLGPDPYPWTYGDLAQEAAEELLAHEHRAEAASLFRQARIWYQTSSPGANTGWKLAQLAYGLQDWTEAERLVDSLLGQQPANTDFLVMAGLLATRLGKRDRAELIAASFADERPYQRGATQLYRARLAALRGERESALQHLREAFARGRVYDLWLHRDPDLLALRGHPTFDELIHPRQ